MKAALCLGSAGFVGRHLVSALLKRDYEVFCVDPQLLVCIDSPPLHEWPGDFEHWVGNPVRSVWPERFDYVFHLAASLTKYNIDERNKLGMEAFADTQLDYSVATWLASHPPKERVVWMSSGATDAHQTENYAFTKYVSERFARQLGK